MGATATGITGQDGAFGKELNTISCWTERRGDQNRKIRLLEY